MWEKLILCSHLSRFYAIQSFIPLLSWLVRSRTRFPATYRPSVQRKREGIYKDKAGCLQGKGQRSPLPYLPDN